MAMYGNRLFNLTLSVFWKIIFQIIDEKSLIKKYQREISVLKQELDQLKKGMIVGVNHEEILTLRQKVSSHPSPVVLSSYMMQY